MSANLMRYLSRLATLSIASEAKKIGSKCRPIWSVRLALSPRWARLPRVKLTTNKLLVSHLERIKLGTLRAQLDDMHTQYGVCGQFTVPSTALASQAGETWVDLVFKAMGTVGVGLLIPSSVYSCLHAHLPQVHWAGRRWATRSYTFKGSDVCVLVVLAPHGSGGAVPDGSGA